MLQVGRVNVVEVVEECTAMWNDMRFVLHLYGMQVNVNVKECTAGGSWFPLMTQMVKFQIFPNSKNLRSNESQKCHSADVGWFTLCGKGQRYFTLMASGYIPNMYVFRI